MMNIFRRAFWIFFVLGACSQQADVSSGIQKTTTLNQALTSSDTEYFAKADRVREFIFPDDHLAHPDFKTEWWYFTGNLQGDQNQQFGYQFTIFRIGLATEPNEDSPWSTDQFYMGHFTISDINNDRFYEDERFQRGAFGLAGVDATEKKIFLDNWTIHFKDGNYELRAATDSYAIILNMKPEKPIVLQGDSGLSQKGSLAGNASYYYSHTRLQSEGELRLGNRRFNVTGNSWFDREWSTSMLEENQSGWDWFSLQLDNGWDLMYYQLRDLQQQAEETSQGVLVNPKGEKVSFTYKDVQLEVQQWWTSAKTGKRYPAKWRLQIPKYDLDIVIQPRMNNQELNAAVVYWEGSVNLQGKMRTAEESNAVKGLGYVELTGY